MKNKQTTILGTLWALGGALVLAASVWLLGWILGIITGIILVGLSFFGAGYAVYYIAIRRQRKYLINEDSFVGLNMTKKEMYDASMQEMTEFRQRLEPYGIEKVKIVSRDGLRLSGLLVAGAPGEKRIAVVIHGQGGIGLQVGVGALYFRERYGFNILLADARAHGESEGHAIGMGWPDRYDYLEWFRFLIERFGEDAEIMLYGVSMGGATVMLLSGEELPPQIKFLCSDCGYTNVYDEIKHVVKNMVHAPVLPVALPARLVCRLFAGYDIKEVSCTDAVKRSRLPMIFIHGEKDNMVPYWMAHKVYEAAATKEKILISIPEGMHGTAWAKDSEGLIEKTVALYIEKYMPGTILMNEGSGRATSD